MAIPRLLYEDAINKEGEDRAILLSVSQQYVLLLLADKLFNNPASFYEDYKNVDPFDITDFNDELIDSILDEQMLATNSTPEEHTYFHLKGINNVGNSIIPSISTGQVFNHFAIQNTPALNDEWYSQHFWLKGGLSYVADGYFVKSSSSGILTWEWRLAEDDSVLETLTQDLYNAALLVNQKLQLGHEFDDDTLTYFAGKMASKNASSTNYFCGLTAILVRS